jgi:hypothetical protein
MSRRIIIIGGPRVGKSTLSRKLRDDLGISNLRGSDDIKHLGWSDSSAEASKWFDEQGDWIVEGVQMARALRKWLLTNPNAPLDVDIVTLDTPFVELSPGQQSMTTGVQTVLRDIQPELDRRGARVHKLKDPKDAISLFRSDFPERDSLTYPERDAEETRKGVIPRMAYKRNLTKAEWELLPETTRKFLTDEKVYVADGENFKLDADDSEDVTKLSAAIKKERDVRAQFEKDLKAEREKFKDVDLEKYNQFVVDAEAKETDELKSKGKIDELIEKSKLREKGINDGWQKKYDELLAQHDKLRVDHRLRKAFEDGGVIPDRIDDAVELTKKVVRLTDKGELEVLDGPDGSPLDASLDIYAKELLKEQKPWLYAASDAAGTGAQNGTHGSAFPDLSKLSATERLKVANRAEAK